MPAVEARRFAGTISDESGRVLGEARMWGMGERTGMPPGEPGDPEDGGCWSGWLRIADLGGRLAPGRYTVAAFEGWTGVIEVVPQPPTRVFETDVQAFTGVGGVPWPAEGESVSPARRPPVPGTPWQGSQGIPPYRHQGDHGYQPLSGLPDKPAP